MVGIVVDASRMHLTKTDWQGLLDYLSQLAGRRIVELHTRDFYAGNSVFRGLSSEIRSALINAIFRWIAERKHHLVYASARKDAFQRAFDARMIPDALHTPWRFMGFHIILAMQKCGKEESGVKGHTIFVFDNEEKKRVGFSDLKRKDFMW